LKVVRGPGGVEIQAVDRRGSLGQGDDARKCRLERLEPLDRPRRRRLEGDDGRPDLLPLHRELGPTDCGLRVDRADEDVQRPRGVPVEDVVVREGDADRERAEHVDRAGATLLEPGLLDRLAGGLHLGAHRHPEHGDQQDGKQQVLSARTQAPEEPRARPHERVQHVELPSDVDAPASFGSTASFLSARHAAT
jgi:hypothetical protein